MKTFRKNFIKVILVLTISTFIIQLHKVNVEAESTLQTNKEEKEKLRFKVYPPLINEEVIKEDTPKVEREITIESKLPQNFSPEFEYRYYETDFALKERKDSEFLKKITKIKESGPNDKLKLKLTIDTTDLSYKSHSFLLGVVISDESDKNSVSNSIELAVPIQLTINKKGEENPIPEVYFDSLNKNNFGNSELNFKVRVSNSSEKILKFGGEVLVVDEDDTILATRPIKTDSSVLLPNENIVNDISIKSYDDSSMGLIKNYKVLVRGTVNNQTHIKSKSFDLRVIPQQTIIILIALIITLLLFFSILFINRNRVFNFKIKSSKNKSYAENKKNSLKKERKVKKVKQKMHLPQKNSKKSKSNPKTPKKFDDISLYHIEKADLTEGND